MNKNLTKAVAAAVLAMGASAANAGITIPAGDWTIDIGGNVNAYYTNTNYSGDALTGGNNHSTNVIQTGLLPSALGIGGKTRQNDLDIAFQFTFFTGVDSGGALSAATGVYGQSGALGQNTLNIRQAFATFGDKSWGTVKFGRDLGIFGSDAILSDMTLLGVGAGAGGGGSSTLGRIGNGYVYADWVGQISYASPNWNGFSFNVGLREPWTSGQAGEDRNNLGFEGKVSYDWAGDVAGKVWLGYINQKHENQAGVAGFNDYTSSGWDIGGKVSVGGFGLVGYYYDGRGLDGQFMSTGLGLDRVGGLQFLNGNKSNDDGGYVQGTYTIAAANNLKLGLSWGQSNSNLQGNNTGDIQNESWIIGAYYPLTKSLNLVAEYTDQTVENDDAPANINKIDANTISLGAILFF